MLAQELVVLGDVPVVEIGDPEIQQDIEEKGEIEDNQVKAIIPHPHHILDVPVNPENENRLDKQVQQQKQPQVCKEFSLHESEVKKPAGK